MLKLPYMLCPSAAADRSIHSWKECSPSTVQAHRPVLRRITSAFADGNRAQSPGACWCRRLGSVTAPSTCAGPEPSGFKQACDGATGGARDGRASSCQGHGGRQARSGARSCQRTRIVPERVRRRRSRECQGAEETGARADRPSSASDGHLTHVRAGTVVGPGLCVT